MDHSDPSKIRDLSLAQVVFTARLYLPPLFLSYILFIVYFGWSRFGLGTN